MSIPSESYRVAPDSEIELTKEECLANGMSEEEYDIQKALGSLPVKLVKSFQIKSNNE